MLLALTLVIGLQFDMRIGDQHERWKPDSQDRIQPVAEIWVKDANIFQTWSASDAFCGFAITPFRKKDGRIGIEFQSWSCTHAGKAWRTATYKGGILKLDRPFTYGETFDRLYPVKVNGLVGLAAPRDLGRLANEIAFGKGKDVGRHMLYGLEARKTLGVASPDIPSGLIEIEVSKSRKKG